MAAAPVSLAAIIEMSVDEHAKMADRIKSTRELTAKAIRGQVATLDRAQHQLARCQYWEEHARAQLHADATELRTLNTVSHNITFAELTKRWEVYLWTQKTVLPSRVTSTKTAVMKVNKIVKKMTTMKDGHNRMLARFMNSQKVLKAVRTALIDGGWHPYVHASPAHLIVDSPEAPNPVPFERFQYLPAAPDAGLNQPPVILGGTAERDQLKRTLDRAVNSSARLRHIAANRNNRRLLLR